MPPHIHNAIICQDSKTSLFQGSKQEDQHTRKTLETLSWVYKPSNNPIVSGAGNPCWSYRSQDLHSTKTVGIKMQIPPPKWAWQYLQYLQTKHSWRNRCILDRKGYRHLPLGKQNKLSWGQNHPLRLPVSMPYISMNNAKLHSKHGAIGQV